MSSFFVEQIQDGNPASKHHFRLVAGVGRADEDQPGE
jgi:hypothetical protein